MKQKLLLVSAATLLMGSSALAAVVDGVRQYPVLPSPTTTVVATDGETIQYLYNVDAKAYFRGGNNYDTRACMSDTLGYKFKITLNADDPSCVILTDSVVKFSEWRNVFTDGVTSIWVDNNTGANFNTWQIAPIEGGNTFKISNLAFPDVVLGGVKGDVGTTGVYLNLYATDTENFDYVWAAVSVADYDAHIAQMMALIRPYYAAQALKALIDEAKENGMDVAAFVAIYEDETKTVEELKTAQNDLAVAYDEFVKSQAQNATLDKPIEITSQFVNLDGSSITNWTRVFTGNGSVGSLSCNTWSVEGNAGNDPTGMVTPFIENWVAKGSTLSNQRVARDTIKVAPGAYRITAKVRAYNESGAETLSGAYIFSNINRADLSQQEGAYFNYNNMLGYWKEDFEVYAVVSADSCLTFGMLLENANFNWLAHKNYRIYALGASDEALKKAATAYGSTAVLYDADDYVTVAIREEWNALVEKYLNGATAAEIMQAQTNIIAYQAVVDENVKAWAAFLAVVEKARAVAGNPNIGGPDVTTLSDYVDFDLEDILAGKTLTTEEIKAETAKLDAMREAAVQNGLSAGTDFTGYLTNVDFSQGTTGWTFKKASGGNVAANSAAKCAEGWNNSDFDIYQIVNNAPVGVYEITVQGFYREGRGDAAWNLYYDEYGDKRESAPKSKAYVYLNDNQTPLANVFDYQVAKDEIYTTTGSLAPYVDPLGVYWYPNDMSAAGQAFDQGAYEVSAFGLVAKAGDALRIGMKGNTTALGDSWAIFTRFKLTYQGYKEEIIRPALQKVIDAMDLTKAMGTDILDEANRVKAAATEALASADGKEMFNALAEILAINTRINESAELFASLTTKNEEFLNKISESTASATTKAEAAALYDEIEKALLDKTYTNTEATEAIEKIAVMITKLSIPAEAEFASDENEVDMTSVLQTPSFDKDGVNSNEGWNGTTGYNFGNDATQKAALAIEFYEKTYDMYQDIAGLPNGTYKVQMNGFYRYGSTTDDYTHYVAGEDGLASLYATGNAGDTVSVAIQHLASDDNASAEQLGIGAESNYTNNDGVTMYIPNDMVSAVGYFDAGKYVNSIYVKVTDGKLRIGVKQAKSVSMGWMIMDNWTLTYYGANSTHGEGGTGIATIESNAPTAKVEMFNINGMPVNALQKGITIVRTTLSDGTVKVRKVSVK